MIGKRTYRYGKSQLTIEFGDITTSEAEILVSSDDYYLSMGGGVSASIRQAGGNSISLDAAKKVPAALGDVIVTTAGSLTAQYVFHAITIGPSVKEIKPEEVIKQTIKRCLQLLDALNLHSIAFPAIGTGLAGFNYEDVAVQMAEAIANDLQNPERSIEVTIYLFDRFDQMQAIDFIRFFEEFAARAPKVAEREAQPLSINREITSIMPMDTATIADEIKSRRLNKLRRLILSLEDHRSKLEEHLIDILSSESKGDIEEVRQKLKENDEVRLNYLTELRSLSEEDITIPELDNQKQKSLTIFVSSTYKDLADHRIEIKDQIARRDMLFRGMEHFGAEPRQIAPATKIVEEVRNADIYLGVFGMRYGSIDQATGLSMTELELNEAEASGKPMLLYIIHDDDATIKTGDLEADTASIAKLNALKKRVMQKHNVYIFSTVDELSNQVYEDLGKV